MKINNKVFNIEESMARVDRILSDDNKLIVTNENFNIGNLNYNQTAIIKAACMSITLLVNKYDLDHDERVFQQYKCILSEFGAVINECQEALEFNVAAVNIFSSLFILNEKNADSIIDTAAKISSLSSILNTKFSRNDLVKIPISIGVSYDTIKITREAFNETVDDEFLWMGDALEESIALSQKSALGFLSNSLYISKKTYEKLSDKYRSFFNYDNNSDCFTSSLINRNLEDWSKQYF